jgi:hypothetical protein
VISSAGGLFGCDLDQVNVVLNDYRTFLDLVFTNAPVTCSESPLMKLDSHHKAYEIEMRACCGEFEAMKCRTQCYMFRTVRQL